jgi:hypothetical protein
MVSWNNQHTPNWVAWEAGLACAYQKAVIVFEPMAERVEYPVPYCSRQVLYDETNTQHFEWLRSVLKDLEVQWVPNIDRNAHCPECELEWHQYNEGIESFPCPSCRTELKALPKT